jgi:hypothetical protein
VELEGERLAFLELEVVHVWLRGDLQVLFLDYFLICIPDEGFERFLPDRVGEFFSHHRCGRLAWPEARQSHRRRVTACRLFFGVANRLQRHGHLDVAVDAGSFLLGDLDIHASNIAGGLRRFAVGGRTIDRYLFGHVRSLFPPRRACQCSRAVWLAARSAGV